MCRSFLCSLIIALLIVVMGSGWVDALELTGKSLDKAGAGKPAVKSAQPRGQAREPECPQTARQARKLGAEEAAKFRRSSPAGTWPGFTHKFRKNYTPCALAPFLKRAYLEEAWKVFEVKKPQRFGRPWDMRARP
jgi:hypothetical protein